MIKFSEWIKQKESTNEMTSTSGGSTSTADIANYARPLVFSDKNNKKTHIIRKIKKEKYLSY